VGGEAATAGESSSQTVAGGENRRPRPPRRPRAPRETPSATPVDSTPATHSEADAVPPAPAARRKRTRHRKPKTDGELEVEPQQQQPHHVGPRRRAFGAQLSTETPAAATATPAPSVPRIRADAPEFIPGPDDLATRIHKEIASGAYECMVCYVSVHRKSKVWNCKCCWAVFHLNCIQKWGKQGLQQESRAPVGAAGEPPRTWRCPACNNPSGELPELYTCWCEKETHPEGTRYLPPHSCGQTCGKQLSSPKKCPHTCTAQCHAGPCAPCTAMGPVMTCFCGKETQQKRCVDTNYDGGFSCGQICDELMPCGEHNCSRPCHPLLCGDCEVMEWVKCYCGNEMKEMRCCDKENPKDSSRLDIHSDDEEEYSDEDEIDEWTGYYECGKVCNR
jgi:transcriptional repressor NF-X1